MALKLPEWMKSEPLSRQNWGPHESMPLAIDTDSESFAVQVLPNLSFRPTLSKVCDFTFWTVQKNLVAQREGRASMSALPGEANKEDDFTLVDLSKVVRGKGKYTRRPRSNMFGQNAGRQQQQATQRTYQPRFQQRQMAQRGGKKDKLGAAYQQQRNQAQNLRWNTVRNWALMAEYAVDIDPEWTQMLDISIQSLASNPINVKDIQIADLKWCGVCRKYEKDPTDRTGNKSTMELNETASLNYSHIVPGARDDDILTGLLEEQRDNIDIIITDQVLVALLTASLSRYAWQINCYRLEGKLIIDKPPTSVLDLLTINETSADITSHHAKARSQEMGVDSAKAELDFAQHMLAPQPIHATYDPPQIETPENRVYRYRSIKLPPGRCSATTPADAVRRKPLRLVVRATLDGAIVNDAGRVEDYVTMHALTEGSPRPGATSWTIAMERQRGAVFVTELKNNACKVAKWVYGGLIAGANTIKVGMITKRNGKNHLLAVQTSRMNDLAAQMGLKVPHAWGLVRELLDIVMSDMKEDGQYIITRDALTPVVKIHFNPMLDTSENEHDEDEV